MNKHLKDVGMSYLVHLFHAWKIAGILIVHGLFPSVWEHKARDLINQTHEV